MKSNFLKVVTGTGAIIVAIKIIGFIKQIFIANVVGTTIEADLFFLATGIIANICYAIENGLNAVIVPNYHEIKRHKGKDKAILSINRVLTLCLMILCVVEIFLIVLAPVLADIFGSKYSVSEKKKLSLYIIIASFSSLFSIAANILGSVLNAEQYFFEARLFTITQSVVPLVFLIILYPHIGILALVWSVPVSYFLQFILKKVFLERRIKIRFVKPDIEAVKLCKKTVPVLIGNATTYINQVVDKIIIASVGVGGVSAVSYAATLNDFVGTLMFGTVITILYTELAKEVGTGDYKKFGKVLSKGVMFIIYILTPITLIVFFYSNQIISFVYGRGKFDVSAINTTAKILVCYGIAYIFSSVKELLARAFNALGNTRIPAINSVVTVGINIVLSIIWGRMFGVEGVALASSISIIFSAAFLGIKFFLVTDVKLDLKENLKNGVRIGFNGLIMVLLSFFMRGKILILGNYGFIAEIILLLIIYLMVSFLLFGGKKYVDQFAKNRNRDH